ncbi:hypothetical protein, partial [Burkholderia cenocepacia]|uniref:hypothetical protein n=1 Tax=Burkholderia cenocepacia TaxID=95486 RepID=UPI0024B7D3EA
HSTVSRAIVSLFPEYLIVRDTVEWNSMKPQASPTLPSTDGSSGCIDPRRSSGRPPATAQACGSTGLGDKPCGT